MEAAKAALAACKTIDVALMGAGRQGCAGCCQLSCDVGGWSEPAPGWGWWLGMGAAWGENAVALVWLA